MAENIHYSKYTGEEVEQLLDFIDSSQQDGILTGKDGLSAYEIAVKNGFEGAEQEWLDSVTKIENVTVEGKNILNRSVIGVSGTIKRGTSLPNNWARVIFVPEEGDLSTINSDGIWICPRDGIYTFHVNPGTSSIGGTFTTGLVIGDDLNNVSGVGNIILAHEAYGATIKIPSITVSYGFKQGDKVHPWIAGSGTLIETEIISFFTITLNTSINLNTYNLYEQWKEQNPNKSSFSFDDWISYIAQDLYPKPNWETDWFDIAPSGSYTFELPSEVLRIEPERRHARLMAKIKMDIGNWKAGDIFTLDTTNLLNPASQEVGSAVIFRDNKAIVTFGDNTNLLFNEPIGGAYWNLTKFSVQIKLLIDIGQTSDFTNEEIAMQKAALQWSKAELDKEYWTGKYHYDGKKIYGKIIDTEGWPNASTKNIPHNIPNADLFVSVKVVGNSFDPKRTMDSAFGNYIVTYVHESDIVITTQTDYSYFTESFAKLEYTCTDR